MEFRVEVIGPEPRRYSVSLSGVTFSNSDGSNRQDHVKKRRPGEVLQFRREPENEHDRYAVAVLSQDGRMLGYVPRGNARLALHLDRGCQADVTVKMVTGGWSLLDWILARQKKSYGLVVEITEVDPDWKSVSHLDELNRSIEKMLKKAKAAEKSSPEKAVRIYGNAIEKIDEFDEMGAPEKYWRTCRHPVNRLSICLNKLKRYEEALEVIEVWMRRQDHVPLSPSDEKAILKRRESLLKKVDR